MLFHFIVLTLEKALHRGAKRWAPKQWIKFCQPPPTVLFNKTILQCHSMTSLLKLLHYTTRTRTLRYALRSREIYAEGPITSPEILSEPPQTQDDSIKTPNNQFRLVLSVTPCMSRISSIESINCSPSPLLFSPTPTTSPTHAPTAVFDNWKVHGAWVSYAACSRCE